MMSLNHCFKSSSELAVRLKINQGLHAGIFIHSAIDGYGQSKKIFSKVETELVFSLIVHM